MVLVGVILTSATAGLLAWRDGSDTLLRLSYKTLLFAGFPGWIVMRVGAEWVASKEHLDNLKHDPLWLNIGMTTADGGGLLLLISLIIGGIGLRRLGKGRGGGGLIKASSVIATVLVAVYVVTVWAMGGKPS
jgi:hypothetical protein